MSLAQITLSTAFVASAAGTITALTPPNPTPEPSSSDAPADSVQRWNLTKGTSLAGMLAPVGLMSLHSASLAYLYPNIPEKLLQHSLVNGLNPATITWSTATAVPLALILCVGVPFRLVPFSTLGKNFTFTLTKPDELVTTGIYRWVQHPSYIGFLGLVFGNFSLLLRTDGPLSCWIPPQLHAALTSVPWWVPAAVVGLPPVYALWKRVKEEERFLRAEFGEKWERWHASTARFIPGVF